MAYFDKYGVEFSDDHRRLVKCPVGLQGGYIIPNGVVEINEDAFFYCDNITSVHVPNSVQSIGDRAFQHCTSMKTVFLPNSLKQIGWCSFMDCVMLQEICIPDNVTRIDEYAFGNCASLRSVFIPKNVYHVYSLSFDNCSNLESIIVDQNNRCFCSVDGVLFWKYGASLYLQKCPMKKRGDYIVPNNVRRVELFAFQNCMNLTSISFPTSVTDVFDSALWGCNNLKRIYVPSGLKDRFAKMDGLVKYANIISER